MWTSVSPWFEADAAHYLLYVLTTFLFALVGRRTLTLSHPY
jgi:hypothetical protein